MIAAARHPAPEAADALAWLCESYWRPVYGFIRRRVPNPDDAADLTQEFFARALDRGYLAQARPDRGRFRSFLMAALTNFLSNEADRHRAIKRGGRVRILSIEMNDGEACLEPASPDDTPERIFERQWALAVLDAALARLRQDCAAKNQTRLFERLQPYLSGDHPAARYADVARELDMSEGTLRTAMSRLRKRFAKLLYEEVAQTVAEPGEVEAELRYLIGVVSR